MTGLHVRIKSWEQGNGEGTGDLMANFATLFPTVGKVQNWTDTDDPESQVVQKGLRKP